MLVFAVHYLSTTILFCSANYRYLLRLSKANFMWESQHISTMSQGNTNVWLKQCWNWSRIPKKLPVKCKATQYRLPGIQLCPRAIISITSCKYTTITYIQRQYASIQVNWATVIMVRILIFLVYIYYYFFHSIYLGNNYVIHNDASPYNSVMIIKCNKLDNKHVMLSVRL